MTISLAAIGIVTDDLAASLAFYRLLGLDIPSDADGHVEATTPAGLRLMWDTVAIIHSFDPGWTRPTGGPAMSLAFECASPDEVDAVVRSIAVAGHRVAHEPWDAVWGQRYATVLDPDGNAVDVYAPLPG